MTTKYTTNISKFYLLLRNTFPEAKSDQDVATALGLSRNVIKELKTKKPTKKIFNILTQKLKLNPEKIKDMIENDNFYEEIENGYKIDNNAIVTDFLKGRDLTNKLSKELYDEFLDFCLKKQYYFVNQIDFTEIVSKKTGLLSVLAKTNTYRVVCRFVNADYIREQFNIKEENANLEIYGKLSINNSFKEFIKIGEFHKNNEKSILRELNRFAKLILKKSYKLGTKKVIDDNYKSLLENKPFKLSNDISEIEFFIKTI